MSRPRGGRSGSGPYAVYGLGSIGKRAHLIDNLGAMRAYQTAAMGRATRCG